MQLHQQTLDVKTYISSFIKKLSSNWYNKFKITGVFLWDYSEKNVLYIPLLRVQVKKSKMLEKHSSYAQNYLRKLYIWLRSIKCGNTDMTRLVLQDKPVNLEMRIWNYGYQLDQSLPLRLCKIVLDNVLLEHGLLFFASL